MIDVVDRIALGGIDSICVVGPFDEALEYITGQGYSPISGRDNAMLRRLSGPDSYVSKNGNYTREAFIYDRERGLFITPDSPIIQNAREATQANRGDRDFYLTPEQTEKALERAVLIPWGLEPIPTDEFAEHELTKRIFGNIADDYGQFLRENNILEMPVYTVDRDYVNKQSQPFARQMWFWDLVGGSELDGWDLDFGGGLRGVKKSAEADVPKAMREEQSMEEAVVGAGR